MSENNFLKKISGILNGERLRPNKSLVIFLIFIGIATFIWFLWTLEKEYTTIISHQVEFTNLPQNRVLVNELPEKLQFEVSGSGYALLRHNWDITKGRLKINFKNIYPGKIEDSEAKITPSLNISKARLSNQLPNIDINSIIPDTITFRFAQMTKKFVRIDADLDLQFEQQYMIREGIKITPDSIEIRGPSTILDTISRIRTAELKLRKVDGSIQRNIALLPIHPKVILSKKRVQIEVPVEQYTEKSLDVPINGINVPDSLVLKVFPSTAKITFRVVVSDFEKTRAENFNLSIDYNQISEASNSKLQVQVLSFPEFIENIKVNPETVAYILENK